MKVRIGTRGSDLALWQANFVAERLRAEGCEVEVVVMKTRGDRIDDVPLQNVEGKAFFTAEIEEALAAGRVDVAVHSHKDLPVDPPPGLIIGAVPERASAAERLLVADRAYDEDALLLPVRRGARVGTSSPRRQAQLLALRPDLEVDHLRGNVPTRVQRLREGRYDAIVLAAAGLDRLGIAPDGLASFDLPLDWMVPAPAQGALAVQVREDDTATLRVVRRALHDESVRVLVAAERRLLSLAGGGCNLALGASVERIGDATWRARVFRGADATAPNREPRWATAVADDPGVAALHAFAGVTPVSAGLAGSGTAVFGSGGPLAGVRVALAGARTDGGALGTRLERLGATVEYEQVLSIEEIEDAHLDGEIGALRDGDAVVVTSKNACSALSRIAPPPSVLVAAVGPATASALESVGWSVGLVGSGGGGKLADALPLASGARVVHPCALDARPELRERLVERGIEVRSVPVYRSRPAEDVVLSTCCDARVYLSPSAVRRVHALDGQSSDTTRIAWGRATADELDSLGLSFQRTVPTDVDDVLRVVYGLANSKEIER